MDRREISQGKQLHYTWLWSTGNRGNVSIITENCRRDASVDKHSVKNTIVFGFVGRFFLLLRSPIQYNKYN